MALVEISEWLDEQSAPNVVWFVKRLSGNDTLANESNQAGPYLPKELLFQLFPQTRRPTDVNPDVRFEALIDSHAQHQTVRGVWYNGKVRGSGTRNEARLTNFGGRSSPVLDPESTGSLTVFAFTLNEIGTAEVCHIWVCDHELEAEVVEERLGPVEPGRHVIWVPVSVPPVWADYLGLLAFTPSRRTARSCFLSADEIPPEWLRKFPSGSTIIERSVGLRRCAALSPDHRLIRRRKCEFELFRSIEEAVFLPRVKQGFSDIGSFIRTAHSVLQSRKTRSGKSLELHAKAIFGEEGLSEDVDFSHNPEIESGKRPDFLFPSKSAYQDASFPASKLRMLAAKTTCKDRWRQILNEADRIPSKHLLTLQEGVSESQFREMVEANVTLVVPQELHEKFAKPIRPYLLTFETFITELRQQQV